TSFESTWGPGQTTRRGTVPAGRAAANQASFADGAPYTRLPGPAHIRSATSACTMTTPRASVGKTASRCSSTGTATLYGKLAASTVGSRGSSMVLRSFAALDGSLVSAALPASASATTTSTRPAQAGARSAIVRGSSAASTGSISTATSRVAVPLSPPALPAEAASSSASVSD